MITLADAQTIYRLEPEIDFVSPDGAITSPVYRLDGPADYPPGLPVKITSDGMAYVDDSLILSEWFAADPRAPSRAVQRGILADAARQDALRDRRSTPREVRAVLQQCAYRVAPLPSMEGYSIILTGAPTDADLHVLRLYGLRQPPGMSNLATADPWLLRLIVPNSSQDADPALWQRTPQLRAVERDGRWHVSGPTDPLQRVLLDAFGTPDQDGWLVADPFDARLPPIVIETAAPPRSLSVEPFDDFAFLEVPMLPRQTSDGRDKPALTYLAEDQSQAILITHRLHGPGMLYAYQLSAMTPDIVHDGWLGLPELRALTADQNWTSHDSAADVTIDDLRADWRMAHANRPSADTIMNRPTIQADADADPDLKTVGMPDYQTLPQTYVGRISAVGDALCLGAAWRWDAALGRNVIIYLSWAATGTTCDALWSRLMLDETITLETPTGGYVLGRSQDDYQRIRKYVEAIAMPHVILVNKGILDYVGVAVDRPCLYVLAASPELATRRVLDKLSYIVKLPLYDWDAWLLKRGLAEQLIVPCEVLGNFVCLAIVTDAERWNPIIAQAAVTFGLPEPSLPRTGPTTDRPR